MRRLPTAIRPSDTVTPVALGTRARRLHRHPEDTLRWLQRTAGNRATGALMQRSCACASSHRPCTECEHEQAQRVARQAIQRPLARHAGDEVGAEALRAAVAAHDAAPNTAAAVSSRNPAADEREYDDAEVVTRRTRNCSVATGPTYSPTGTIPVTTAGGRKSATFSFAANFQTASWYEFWSSANPACCSVRQYIKWDKAFQDWRGGPPHSGFPSGATHGTWYEDRDAADKRYGHRSGTHSDPIAGGGDEYTTGGVRDQTNGNRYDGRDSPGGPTAMTGQFQFKLAAVDTCNSNTTKATSPVITINW